MDYKKNGMVTHLKMERNGVRVWFQKKNTHKQIATTTQATYTHKKNHIDRQIHR